MDGRKFVGRSIATGAIGALCVVGGGIGIATAANGGSLILGGSNTATHTTTLKDTSDTPLSLITKKHAPPLEVNSKALVKHLNAGELGGLSAGKLSTGSTAQLKVNILSAGALAVELKPLQGTSPNQSLQPTAILATAKLAAGNYMVTGTTAAEEAVCWVGTTSATGKQQYGITEEFNTAVTTEIKVKKGQRIHEYCAGLGTSAPGGAVLTAGLTAMRVATVSQGVSAVPHLSGVLLKK